MRILIILAFGLFFIGSVQAQVGSSISADGTAPNDNAMLDVKSPATGAGKGILIPRVTLAQRSTANASLAGGLLDNSGNLRGGAAQGLIVYQTDGSQGLYFNTSQAAAPTWVYLGNSTTNYLPLTGGTMSGVLDMGAQVISNVEQISYSGYNVSVGREAIATNNGTALGAQAKGSSEGTAVGRSANGNLAGVAMGHAANGYSGGVAMGYAANGSDVGAALGDTAKGTNSGAAVGYYANGANTGAAMGRDANGFNSGAAVGVSANGSVSGAAVGKSANGSDSGAAMGEQANGYFRGAAMGRSTIGSTYGAAMGDYANGSDRGAAVGAGANGYYRGAAMGWLAIGTNSGAAVGQEAQGYNSGVAMGYSANGAQTNVAIGMRANAQGGTERIAIGHNVTNNTDNSTRIRGNLYLDGGSGIYTNVGGFGSSDWGVKAFTIEHPLDPGNKVLRHFCLEGPQVWNVYAGNVQLVNGQAVVQLPDYYSALNLVGSEIYSLTVVGALAQIAVGTEVNENRFIIIGDKDVKVSWTIKVLRNDPGCLEDLRRRPVEQMKSELETGN